MKIKVLRDGESIQLIGHSSWPYTVSIDDLDEAIREVIPAEESALRSWAGEDDGIHDLTPLELLIVGTARRRERANLSVSLDECCDERLDTEGKGGAKYFTMVCTLKPDHTGAEHVAHEGGSKGAVCWRWPISE